MLCTDKRNNNKRSTHLVVHTLLKRQTVLFDCSYQNPVQKLWEKYMQAIVYAEVYTEPLRRHLTTFKCQIALKERKETSSALKSVKAKVRRLEIKQTVLSWKKKGSNERSFIELQESLSSESVNMRENMARNDAGELSKQKSYFEEPSTPIPRMRSPWRSLHRKVTYHSTHYKSHSGCLWIWQGIWQYHLLLGYSSGLRGKLTERTVHLKKHTSD